jgi:gamma-glutamyl-gamma-aminobutyraldehyde dehydrogenase
MLMGTWKFAPALSAGNTVVLKPAEQAPLSCLRLAELFIEAGGPPGVFNVINGIGEVAGQALALHNDVDKVTFTGSAEVGKLMLQYAGQSNMKRVSLECGGKTPQIFMSDINDLGSAVSSAYHGIFANMGEVCNAGSRLLVDRKIYDAFVDKFVADGKNAYRPGDPLDPETNMGPLVTTEAQERVLGYIESGKEQGATPVVGGGIPAGLEKGYYVEPTVFRDVTNDMKIAQEEIFGPVLSVIEYETEQQAIDIANDSDFGLSGSVWTSDLDHAAEVARQVRTGVVAVNSAAILDMASPFGGFKNSGIGRELGAEGLEPFCEVQSVLLPPA